MERTILIETRYSCEYAIFKTSATPDAIRQFIQEYNDEKTDALPPFLIPVTNSDFCYFDDIKKYGIAETYIL